MLKLPVYLDHQATTPCAPSVMEAMLPWFTEQFGNASSRNHAYGWSAAEAVDLARERVARLIGSDKTEIVFTSGATESNNLALKGVFERYRSKGHHLITQVTEHKAVLDACAHLEKLGAEVTYLPVNARGHISLQQLEAAIRPETILISAMYANNETGVLMPVQEIGTIAKRHNVLFFCDATQAVGKIPVEVIRDGIDLLALSAHKFYGPKGVGALYIRRRDPRVSLTAQQDGGGHERNNRSGTLNVPGIVGLGAACELASRELHSEAGRLSRLRDRLEADLLALGDVQINGDPGHRLPHCTNLTFNGVDSEALMMGLNRDLALSSGSACTSATIEPSYVLKQMGLTDEQAHGALRFALGRSTDEEAIGFTVGKISTMLRQLRILEEGS